MENQVDEIPTNENTEVDGMADFFFSQFYQFCIANKKKFCVWHDKCYYVDLSDKPMMEKIQTPPKEYHGPANVFVYSKF